LNSIDPEFHDTIRDVRVASVDVRFDAVPFIVEQRNTGDVWRILAIAIHSAIGTRDGQSGDHARTKFSRAERVIPDDL
jgi:hypothetical protein